MLPRRVFLSIAAADRALFELEIIAARLLDPDGLRSLAHAMTLRDARASISSLESPDS